MNSKFKQIVLCLFIISLFSFTSLAQTSKGLKVTSSENPSPSKIVEGNTYALIIGISKYQSSAIPQLNYADADAKAFHDFLISTGGGKVPEENILMLLNDSAKVGDIEMHGLAWLEERNAKKGDRVFIYFSGHGITIGNNDSYLLANDIKEGFNKYNIMLYNGIPVMQLKRNTIQPMTAEGVEVFLLIDACRNRAVENERNSIKLLTSNSALTENAGDIMLISAENEQSSREDNPANQKWGGHGVFTYYLLNGLEGMADGMGDREDGVITLGELKHYLSDNVNKATGYHQTPFISDGNNQVSLSKVDVPTLAALKQKLQQSSGDLAFAPNTSKGVVPTDADETAQSTYTLFSQALSKGKLLGDSSADYYFTNLENYSHVGSLKQDALYSLCAALMNDGQKIINAYLNSNLKSLIPGLSDTYNNEDSIFAREEPKMNRLYELRKNNFLGNKYNENIKATWLFMKARKWANSSDKRQLNEAREAIQQAIKIDSTQSYLYHTLAMIYFSDNNYKMAIDEEDKALMITNNWADALCNAGLLYINLKDYKKAEDYCLKALHSDSVYKQAYIGLACAYFKLHEYDKCEKYLLHLIQLYPAFKDAYLFLALNYTSQKKYHKSIEYVQKSFALDSVQGDSYCLLGMNYLGMGKYAKAEKYLLTASQLDSTYADPCQGLGALYYILKQYDKSEEYSLRAIHLDSTGIDAYTVLAANYIRIKQYDKAEKSLLKVIQIDSTNNDAYFDIAVMNSLQGKKERSIEYLEIALRQGYKNYKHIEKDTNFHNIRNEPEFKKLMAKYFPDKEK